MHQLFFFLWHDSQDSGAGQTLLADGYASKANGSAFDLSSFLVDGTYGQCYIGRNNQLGSPYLNGGSRALVGRPRSRGPQAASPSVPPGRIYAYMVYDAPMNDTDFNGTFAFVQSHTGIARRRLSEQAGLSLPPAGRQGRPPPPPASEPKSAATESQRSVGAGRRLQQSTTGVAMLEQDLINALAAAASVPTSYVSLTEITASGTMTFTCTLNFPADYTGQAIVFYGLINMYPNQVFGSSWKWPVPVITTSVQMSGLALTWTAPPPPPIVRLPPPPPPPLSPPSLGALVLTLAPSFAVAQWAVDQIACDSSGCTPYDRRIAYQPVLSNATAWGAMKDMPFSVVLTSSRAISGVTTASLSASGFQVTQVIELSPGRQFQFDLLPAGTGNFSLSIPAGAVVDLGTAGRRLLASSPAPASNSLTVSYDSTPPKPTFQYQ